MFVRRVGCAPHSTQDRNCPFLIYLKVEAPSYLRVYFLGTFKIVSNTLLCDCSRFHLGTSLSSYTLLCFLPFWYISVLRSSGSVSAFPAMCKLMTQCNINFYFYVLKVWMNDQMNEQVNTLGEEFGVSLSNMWHRKMEGKKLPQSTHHAETMWSPGSWAVLSELRIGKTWWRLGTDGGHSNAEVTGD